MRKNSQETLSQAPMQSGMREPEAERQADEKALAPGLDMALFPPPPELFGQVLTLFHFRSNHEPFTDLFPAMSGFFSITLQGTGWFGTSESTRLATAPATLVTPTNHATAISTDGPFEAVGAVLSPLGWAALTGLHAGDHAGQMYDAAALLGQHWADLAAQLREDRDTGLSGPADHAAALAAMLVRHQYPVDADHVRLIAHVVRWLASSFDPPLAQLIADSVYSQRQVQRLVERYFGCSPKTLVRQYRAIRTFAKLVSPATTDQQAAELIDLYYDQSHLIREFRQFIGRTPRQLRTEQLPVLSALIDPHHYRAIWPRQADEQSG